MTNLNLVPPAGKTGVFSRIRDPRVYHLQVPQGQRVMVLQTTPGGCLPRAGRLVEEFQRANLLQFLTNDGSTSARENLGRELSSFNPNIVFLPHPDAQNLQHQNLYQSACEFLTGRIGISYETPDINDIFNLYVFFDETGMKHKMQCIKPFRSQLRRVRFDLAAKYAARAAALELKNQDLPENLKTALNLYPYAERFVLAGFFGREADFSFYSGRRIFLASPPHPEFDTWEILRGQKVAFYSPHHDDLEIPAAFTMSEITRAGTLVHNFVLSTGKEGVVKGRSWIEKFLIRNAELVEASLLEGIVPIELALIHDFPEHRPLRRWEAGAEKILYGFLERFSPRLIFLPLKGDPHPDHKLMHELGMKIAGRAFKDGHWSERKYPNVVFYASPWYSGPHGTNAYFYFDRWRGFEEDPAAEYAAKVNAIVGTELAMNQPGASPPQPQKFGGRYAERFLIHTLTKSD